MKLKTQSVILLIETKTSLKVELCYYVYNLKFLKKNKVTNTKRAKRNEKAVAPWRTVTIIVK